MGLVVVYEELAYASSVKTQFVHFTAYYNNFLFIVAFKDK